MAHPYASHRQGKLEHDRVTKIAGGAPSVAMKTENALGSLKRGEQSAKVDRITTAASGSGATKRLDKFARGGKVAKGTNVNIIIGAQDKPPAPAMLPPMPPPMPAPPPGPMAGPPGAGPGLPPMMPPRSAGGRATFAKGGAVKGLGKVKEEGMRNGTQVDHRPGKGDLGDIRTKPPITYARGGKVPKFLDGGAGSGVGRLEKAEEYGKRR